MDERNRSRDGTDGERALWRPRVWANQRRSRTTGGLDSRVQAAEAGSGQPPSHVKRAYAPAQGPTPDGHGAETPGAPRQPANALGGDDDELNPPWERESGRYPVAGDEERQEQDQANARWGWHSSMGHSYAGADLDDLTGTGRFAAVVPLHPGDRAWSGGVRAPRKPPTDASRDVVIDVGGLPPAAPIRPVAPGQAEVDLVEEDKQPSVQMRAMRAGNLARATAIVSVALLLSRVLGLVRTTLFAATFGLSVQADAFTNAFVLPDTIFNIVAGGALASAFIPVFTSYLIEKRDRGSAWHLASAALNMSMIVLTGIAVLAFIFAPQALDLTMHPYFVGCGTPGNVCEGPMIVDLTRIMLLQPIFLGGATIAVAILQARQSFVLPAVGQVIYTVSLIGGIAATIADNRWGVFGGNLGIYGPTWGVVAGAVLQLLIQLPGLARAKMQYRPTLDFFSPGMREMIRLMIPRLINAAMLYVSIYINRDLLGLLHVDAAAYGYVTAFTLVMLPVGVFGMAVSQASFPTLAAFVAAGEWRRLRFTIMQTVRGVTYLAVPATLGIIVLADPLSRLLLAHGSFDFSRLDLVSTPLIYFATGLLGLSLVEILVRSFYALHDTRTAVEVSILQFMFVIGMSILLLDPMGAGGLALATALGSTGEALVLLLLLRGRIGGLELSAFARFFVLVLAASVAAALSALAVYMLGNYVLPLSDQSFPIFSRSTAYLATRLIAAILVACGVYYGFSRVLGISDTVPVERIARRLVRR